MIIRIKCQVLFIISCSALVGCTPQKKLQRLLVKHPELAESQIEIIDTTLKTTVPAVELLPVIPLEELKALDTFNWQKDHLNVSLWQNEDMLHVSAECDSHTVYIPFEKRIETQKIIYKKPRDALIWGVAIVLLVLYVLKLMFKKK